MLVAILLLFFILCVCVMPWDGTGPFARLIADRGGRLLSCERQGRQYLLTYVEADGRIVRTLCSTEHSRSDNKWFTREGNLRSWTLHDGLVVGHAEPGEEFPGATYLARQREIEHLLAEADRHEQHADRAAESEPRAREI